MVLTFFLYHTWIAWYSGISAFSLLLFSVLMFEVSHVPSHWTQLQEATFILMYTTRLTSSPPLGHIKGVFGHNHLTCYWPISPFTVPLPLIVQEQQENMLGDDLSFFRLTCCGTALGSETGLWPYLIFYELLQAKAWAFGIITSYAQGGNERKG